MAISDVTRTLGPSSSQSQTGTAIGHAEDYSKIITNIDPDVAFFVSEFGDGEDAQTLKFGWLTEGLRPPQNNAHLEKEEYTSQEVGSLEAAENNCQRFVSSGYVTEAQQKVKKIYTPEDEKARLLDQTLKQHARDIEYALCFNSTTNAETGSTPAKTGGVPYFMQAQTLAVTVDADEDSLTAASAHNMMTGDFVYLSGTALPTGASANTIYYIRRDGEGTSNISTTKFYLYNSMKGAIDAVSADKVNLTSTGTSVVIVKNNVVDLGGAADYTLDNVNAVMQMCFNRGGNPTLAVMSPAKKNRFSKLITAATDIQRGMGKSRRLDLVADVMETDFGVITAKPHRLYADNRVDFLDMEYWELKWFTRTHEVTGIAKTGSYDEFFVESWLGLKGTQPKASGSLIGIQR